MKILTLEMRTKPRILKCPIQKGGRSEASRLMRMKQILPGIAMSSPIAEEVPIARVKGKPYRDRVGTINVPPPIPIRDEKSPILVAKVVLRVPCGGVWCICRPLGVKNIVNAMRSMKVPKIAMSNAPLL